MYNTIEIGGREYPIHFGTAALNQYCIKHKIDKLGTLLTKLTGSIPRRADGSIITDEKEAEEASDFDFRFSLNEIVDMLRFGINSGYRKAGQPEQAITEEEAFDLFDEKPGLAMEVFGMFAQSVMSTFTPEEKKITPGRKPAKALKN